MIPRGVPLHLGHLDPECLAVVEADHMWPMNPAHISMLVRQLRLNPDQDCDPIVVMLDNEGRLRVKNGRHRKEAYIEAGRLTIPAIVYMEPPVDEQPLRPVPDRGDDGQAARGPATSLEQP